MALTEFCYIIFFFKGIPGYKEYWDAVKSNPDKFIFPSLKSAMYVLEEKPNTILFSYLNRMEHFYRDIQNANIPAYKVIKDRGDVNKGFIFSKYSPLKPLFFQFGLYCFDTGIYDKYKFEWIGNGIPPEIVNHPAISLDHTLACFIFLTCIMVLCTLMVLVEFTFSKFKMCNRVL